MKADARYIIVVEKVLALSYFIFVSEGTRKCSEKSYASFASITWVP